MGYDVHITRAEDWADGSSDPITLEEWLTYVADDPEMQLDGIAETTAPDGTVLRYQGEGLSVWTAYSGHGLQGNMVWFDYGDGNITVKNPDAEILAKMNAIAEALGARVQGDEGEFYDAEGQSDCQSPPMHLDLRVGRGVRALAGGCAVAFLYWIACGMALPFVGELPLFVVFVIGIGAIIWRAVRYAREDDSNG
jgi:hypothetical protein